LRKRFVDGVEDDLEVEAGLLLLWMEVVGVWRVAMIDGVKEGFPYRRYDYCQARAPIISLGVWLMHQCPIVAQLMMQSYKIFH
jgi:hypothetical protein